MSTSSMPVAPSDVEWQSKISLDAVGMPWRVKIHPCLRAINAHTPQSCLNPDVYIPPSIMNLCVDVYASICISLPITSMYLGHL